MTSWLNTKGLTQLAKSALNEAQKTIDKALEVPPEETVVEKVSDNVKDSTTPLPHMWNSWKESLLSSETKAVDKELSRDMDDTTVDKNISSDQMYSSTEAFVNPATESFEHTSDQESINSIKDTTFVETTLTTTSNLTPLDANLLEEAMTESVRPPTSSASSPKSFDLIASNESNGNDHDDSDIELMTKPTSISSSDSVKSLERNSTMADKDSVGEDVELLRRRLGETILLSNELKNERDELKHQLNEAKVRENKMDELAKKLESEWSNRCSELNKKLEDTGKMNEKLSHRNQVLEKEASSRMSQSELSEVLGEKDELISELRTEGDKLAKEVAKHSDITRKLRQKERTLDKDLKTTTANLETTKSELESTKKLLDTKENSEKKYLALIEELRSANSAFEVEHNRVSSDLEDALAKDESLKTSLESAYKEIGELKRAQADRDNENKKQLLMEAEENIASLQSRVKELEEEYRVNELALQAQLEDLRLAHANESRDWQRRLEDVRREREDIQRRLEESEQRHEDLSNNIASTTRPLLRQIESLQTSLNESQLNSERAERNLSERLQQTSTQLATTMEQERVANQELIVTRAKIASLQTKCDALLKEKDALSLKLDHFETSMNEVEELKREKRREVEAARQRGLRESSELRSECETLRYESESMKVAVDTERKKALGLMEQLTDRDKRIREMSLELDTIKNQHQTIRASPLSHFVFDPSANSKNIVVEQRSMLATLDSDASSPVPTTAAGVEALQALLKQREGELSQLQLELTQLQRSRDSMRQEIIRLTHVADQVDSLVKHRDDLEKSLQDLETRYQTLLTMYGEKSEEAEELRLDIVDVKEMYKSQIDELLKRSI